MTDPQLPPPPSNPVPPIPAAPEGQHYLAPPAQPPAPAYQNPAYQAPPGAYAAPVGGYGAPVGGYNSPAGPFQAPQPGGPQPTAPKSAVLGVIAFVCSIVAAIVMPIIAGVAGYQIGFRLPSIANEIDSAASDLAALSPVRDQVLMGEIGFWVGTLAGIAAIVLGIMAIAKRQGRVWGVIALILGVIGPMIFFIVLSITLASGAGSGAVSQFS
ncbi:hypothetical protein [Microbacterium sp.]|uniref:hypothetical protein n=1 Tax=Microbacterium sp. TaxID=51671 RepID=UPI003F9E3CCA